MKYINYAAKDIKRLYLVLFALNLPFLVQTLTKEAEGNIPKTVYTLSAILSFAAYQIIIALLTLHSKESRVNIQDAIKKYKRGIMRGILYEFLLTLFSAAVSFSFVLIYEYVLHLDMQNYGFGFVTVLAALDVLFSAGRAVSYPLIITDSDSPFHDTWKMIRNLGAAWLIYQLIRVLPILIFYKNGIEMINWIRLGIGTLLCPLWYNFEYNFYITALNTEKSR